jgi:hypothetical protein
MICPSCRSANPDDVRFCLHCGHWLQEIDEEVTQVRSAPRVVPQTTIAADFRPPTFGAYEQPIEKRWPFWIAFAFLSLLALVGIGLLAAVLIQQSGGAAVDLPKNQRLTVLANATPAARPTVRPTPYPAATPTPTPTPEQPREVLKWSGWVADGMMKSWSVPTGNYMIEFTATGDGGTIELSGSDCFKTQPMLRWRQRCDLAMDGQLVIANPTVFRTGAATSVTVRVVRLPE